MTRDADGLDANGLDADGLDAGGLPDERIHPVLRRYSEGEVSAYDAACEIQDLHLPGYDDPSASEVILWAKRTGFGIPTPSEEDARAEADAILNHWRRQSDPLDDQPGPVRGGGTT